MLSGNIYAAVAVALVMRLALMVYGIWQDQNMQVKFTDIDYKVFTDAARFITQGQSPYSRATYRYTPLLSVVLTPNIYFTPHFGKILFIGFDVLAGYLIYAILRQESVTVRKSVLYACLWLFNPLPMAVSARGNAESIMAGLVLSALYCLGPQLRPRWTRLVGAAVLYALSVHVKIYPVTYVLPIYLSLGGGSSRLLGLDILPNKRRLLFLVVTGLTFILLTGGCYYMYEQQFLQETYLYHITRKDTRHNFSPYFYMLYLLSGSEHGQVGSAGLGAGSALIDVAGLAAFVPQAVLLVVSSFKYHSDLPLCCFIHTYLFVTFNKVCTSQYFLWYLCLLPLIVPYVKMSLRTAVFLVLLWFLGQALWLSPAYYLEFEGKNTFTLIWIAGLVFFAINVYILHALLSHYRVSFAFLSGRRFQSPASTNDCLSRRPLRGEKDD